MPLQLLWNEVDDALRSERFYIAVHLALSMPDICSSLETSLDERLRFKVEERYVAWCKKYLEPHFKLFTAQDCWALRGGVLHNGMMFGHPKARYDRIMFTLPHPSGGIISEGLSSNNGGTKDRVLMLNAIGFCQNMGKSVGAWFRDNALNETVKDNLPNLLRLRPNGLAPHIVGMAVIA